MKLEEVLIFFRDNGYHVSDRYINLHNNSFIEIKNGLLTIQTIACPFVYEYLVGNIYLKSIKHISVNRGTLYIKVENDMGTVLIEVKA